MDYSGYKWIKVPKLTIPEELPWNEKFSLLDKHHIAETSFLIDEIRKLAAPKRICVYAGTFDPLTLGHWQIIEAGARLFDKLYVSVGINRSKTPPWFTAEERKAMIQECLEYLELDLKSKIEVDAFENKYLVRYAANVGANYLLRGMRSEQDFDYEKVMRNVNKEIAPAITTVFLMPDKEFAEVSSSLVKGMIGPEGCEEVVKKFVPHAVFVRLMERAKSLGLI